MSGWGVACCPQCPGDVPLVSTCYFYKAEFYCLECGGQFGFLQPSRAQNPGPELDALCAAYEAEWASHAPALITPRSWRVDCELCKPRGEFHAHHVTPEEWEAHTEAEAWIAGRRKVAA